MRTYSILLIITANLALSACQTGKTAWQYYDECAKIHTSFVETMKCGKKTRNETCEVQNTCSDRGNALVLYTDSLVTSVRSKEMSEAEATRKWVEYRTAEQNSYMQSRAAATAAILDSAPQTTNCNTYGGYTNCTTY